MKTRIQAAKELHALYNAMETRKVHEEGGEESETRIKGSRKNPQNLFTMVATFVFKFWKVRITFTLRVSA